MASIHGYYTQDNDRNAHSKLQLCLESEVIVEILLMLRGIDGSIYHRDSNNQSLSVNHKIVVSHLTPLILFQQLQNFAKFGNHIRYISDFYTKNLLPSPTQQTNPVLQALSSALREYCECFYVEISTLAKRCEGLSLLELESLLAPKRRDMETLSQVLQKMREKEKDKGLDGIVLGTLYNSAVEMSLLGDARGMGIMLHLLVKTAKPYFDALGMWLEEGKLPIGSESWFMVARNEKISPTEVLPAPVSWGEGYILKPDKIPNFLQPVANEILVSGKSIVLLREIFADFANNYEKTPAQQKINVYVIGPSRTSLHDQFVQEVLEYFPQATSKPSLEPTPPTLALSRIKLDSEMTLENPVGPFLGSISSYMGNEISPFLEFPDLDYGLVQEPTATTSLFSPKPLPTAPSNFQENFNKYSPLPENSFTLQPISVILKKGVIEPILERYNAGSQLLMQYLHEICLLHQHLVNLRSFYLMEAGFSFHQFTISLFEKVDKGEVLGSYELNRILQDALESAGKREAYSEYMHLLSIELPEVTPSMQPSDSNPTSKPTYTAQPPEDNKNLGTVLEFEPYTLPSLKASYLVPAPLDIIITPTTLGQYSAIFSFLLAVKRSKYAIESTIRTSLAEHKNFASSMRSSTLPSVHSLHILRAKLLHFVNNLQHYLFTRVLQTGWDEFMQGVENAVDLDDLVKKHSTYVTKIFSQCLLNKKAAPVLSVIKRILNLALRFSRNFLIYQHYQDVSSDTTNLNTSDLPQNFFQEFKTIDTYVSQQVSILVSILQDIVAQKTLPHLMDLLLRLNYNQYYLPL